MKLLHDHFIVCGYSRIGDFVVRHLRDQHRPCVIVEREDELADRLEADGQFVVRGDAGHEETLRRAGIERARGVIVVTPSDAENMLITITARQLAPELPIVVRCDEESNAGKLMRVGATRVITPNSTGAAQIALAATKPYVIDLIDLATGSGQQEFELRQILVPAGSAAHGQTLRQLAVGSRFGLIVIGIKSQGPGDMQFNPSADSRLAAGDMLITVGREEQFRELERFLGQS
jgi:voltage-gated potassium channel